MSKGKQQILVVDDDQDYCNLVSELLSAKFDCLTALSGEEGLTLFRNNPQLIIVLVDLNLPDISGFEVCLKLSQYKADREFATFVISGDDDIDTKMNAFESGADDYIAKPFEIKDLFSRINRSIAYVEGKEKLKIESTETKNLANIAMAQASQYSYVMNFFKSLNHCVSHAEIATLFFEAMSFFQLNASLMLSCQTNNFYDSNLADVSPIE